MWFWVHGMGAMLVKFYSAGVCGFGCMVWALCWLNFTVQVCGFGCTVWVLCWLKFTVQVCVVLGAWYGCYIGQTDRVYCVGGLG